VDSLSTPLPLFCFPVGVRNCCGFLACLLASSTRSVYVELDCGQNASVVFQLLMSRKP
jgi:hypothetical protein